MSDSRGTHMLWTSAVPLAAERMEESARFAEEWPEAVSLGWDEVMHLLKSCCTDPNTQQMLRAFARDSTGRLSGESRGY